MRPVTGKSSPLGKSDATRPSDNPPLFSALMLAGMIMRPFPTGPLNPLLSHIADRIGRNHPTVVDRLSTLAGTHFVIRPTDLPHDIRLIIEPGKVCCQIDDSLSPPPHVTISGPFQNLMDMLNGTLDGDALFFSRSLTVEGDTEALLTLRNAMDSDDISLGPEILDTLGPAKAPVALMARMGGRLFIALSRDMEQLQRAITQPLAQRCGALEEENQALSRKLNSLDQKLAKSQSRLQSLSRKIAS